MRLTYAGFSLTQLLLVRCETSDKTMATGSKWNRAEIIDRQSAGTLIATHSKLNEVICLFLHFADH